MRGRQTNIFTGYALRITSHVSHGWILCVPLVFLTCASPPFIVPKSGTLASDFTLKDQHDAEFRLSQFRGENVLLFGFDKDSIGLGETWLNLFLEQYPDDLRILPIANGSGVSLFARLFLKGKLKANLREAGAVVDLPSILLDWTGEVSRQYGLALQIPTVVLIDRAGHIRLVHPLPQLTVEEVREVFDRINQQIRQ